MRLKSAGTINKFQIVNRKGQPVLQTGMRNKNYFDYQGVVEEEDQMEQEDKRTEDGPWTTVTKKGKKVPPVGPTQSTGRQQQDKGQPTDEGATHPSNWVQLAEKDFPELLTGIQPNNAARPQQSAAKQVKQPSEQSNVSNNQQQQSGSHTAPHKSATQRNNNSSKPRSNQTSRGPRRNSNRQPSRVRVSALKSDKQSNSDRQNSRSSLPIPFRSYLKGGVYNISGGGGPPQRKDNSNSNSQVTHERHHRER
jgi:hypothetical protein